VLDPGGVEWSLAEEADPARLGEEIEQAMASGSIVSVAIQYEGDPLVRARLLVNGRNVVAAAIIGERELRVA